MGVGDKERIVLLAAFGSWQIFAMQQAFGGPPPEKALASPNRESVLEHESNFSSSAGLALPSGHLDLRPPTSQPLAVAGVATDAPGTGSDGARHRLFAVQNALRLETVAGGAMADSARVSQPATSVTGGHIMSPMETLTHNFRQQGLPVARLFENKDSLVHLGLDQKGRPGLWVVRRLH